MTIKNWFIKSIALDLEISEKIVNAVISHEFEGIEKALMTTNKSVQICGFGKFIFREKIAIKQLEKYKSQIKYFTEKLNDPSSSEQLKREARYKLDTVINNLEHLKPKFNGMV